MADTTGNFQDLLQFSGDTLYNLGEEFVIGNSLATTITQAFSNSAGILVVAAAPTANATVFMPTSGGTLLTNIKVSAGAASNNLSAITFSNSNGVSFGLNGSTMTASIATSLSNINVSAGTTSNNLSAITFSNLNGVSFGLNGSVITASAAGGANIKISAGTTSNLLSAVTFSNSNNVSFGLNGSVITASAIGGGGANINISAGTTSGNVSAVTFQDSNGIVFGFDGSNVTAAALVGTILWDNSQAAAGNRCQTWAQVYAAITASAAPLRIVGGAGQLLSIPVGTWTIPSGTIFAGISEGNNPTTAFSFADGAIFSGMTSITFEGCTALFNSNSVASLSFDYTNGASILLPNGVLENAGSNEAIDVGSNTLEVIGSSACGLIPIAAPIFALGATGTLYLYVFGGTDAVFQNDFLTGSAGSFFYYFYDSSGPEFSNAGFSGTFTPVLSGGQGGPTGYPQAVNVGALYYDTTLGVLMAWNGAGWVPAIGASAGINAIQAGTQTAVSGTVIFSNSNGVSFGLNANVVTAEFGGLSVWQNGAPVTSFASSRAFVSFQPILVDQAITVTNVLFLASMSQGTASSASSGGFNVSIGLYTLNGGTSGTFSRASSASSFVSWTSGAAYSSQSGVGYRAVSVASWALTPGPYIFAMALQSTVLSSISLTLYGTASLLNIGASGQGTMISTMPWAPGFSVSSVAALPASYGVSNTASVVRTGGSINNQAWISFMGT